MTRDLKTSPNLIALARSRRMQRALAHAHIHRDRPLPALATTLGYMTTTACVAGDGAAVEHRMSVLGVSIAERVAYVLEQLGPSTAPIVYRMYLHGARLGFLVPVHAWYEHGAEPAEIRARLVELAPRLSPLAPAALEGWMLSTRVVQRRAMRVPDRSRCELAIRKFALQLHVEPVGAGGPSGTSTVTAFLRPSAQLAGVWWLPDGKAAIARVSYTGIPSGLGLDKDTMILLTPTLYEGLSPQL